MMSHAIASSLTASCERGCLQPPSWTHHTLHFNILIYANCQGMRFACRYLWAIDLYICVTGSLILIVSTLVLIVFPVSAAYATCLSLSLCLSVCLPAARCHNLLEVWPSRVWTGGDGGKLVFGIPISSEIFRRADFDFLFHEMQCK